MLRDSIYLAHVSWREKEKIGNVLPGKYPVRVEFNSKESRYEAAIPAYHREGGVPFQLAVKSPLPCSVLTHVPEATSVLVSHTDYDTAETWWVERGSWDAKGGYHDALSFRHPGGHLDLSIGDKRCRIYVYHPSLTESEFLTVLNDLKSWCWRMAVDELCYVAVATDTDLKVLSEEFKQLVCDFNRHVGELLKLPHCELREGVAYQSPDRLRPNMESLRFIAQRGDRKVIPGRAAVPHYATPENRLVHGMVQTVSAILRPQLLLAAGKVERFQSTAVQYRNRAQELQEQEVYKIDSKVLDQNIERLEREHQYLVNMQQQGFQVLVVENERGAFYPDCFKAFLNGNWCLVDFGKFRSDKRILEMLRTQAVFHILCRSERSRGPVRLVTELLKVTYRRHYQKELQKLCGERTRLQQKGWKQAVPVSKRNEMLVEAKTLLARTRKLEDAAHRTYGDHTSVSSMIDTTAGHDRALRRLGVAPLLHVVPSIVFLQAPHYAGALSAFRRLKEISGLEQKAIDDLLSLEEAGIKDWPSIYERWCLVSLIRVLQDDFKFVFDKEEVRRNLLAYCTSRKTKSFFVTADRKDMNLALTLHYQYRLPNGREPDFLLEITDLNSESKRSVKAVFDAKSCSFVRRPESAQASSILFLDDCVDELVNKKDYGQGGSNLVFVLHSSQNCITFPTTLQPWASSTACGGDSVFHWDREGEKPRHRYGAVRLRPHDSSHLKLVVLRLVQLGLGRKDICASCGAGGRDIIISTETTRGGYEKYLCHCSRCSFLTVRTHCINCGSRLFKNQGYWTYDDLHPTEVWNNKCWSCGTLL